MRIAIALIIAGLVFMYWGRSGRAAEQQFEIVLFERPMPNDAPDRQRIYVISEAYPSKERCLQVLASVRIRAPNAKAKCLPKED